ncbi:MAG: UDP-2,3-diacylglucosamine diphosphatase [Niabella sp.]
MDKRQVEVVVVSDLHLGTYASKAREFAAYLKSVKPRLLILNGDIIDGWQFSKRYFPTDHADAIRQIFGLLSKGTRVVYVTGNHDEILRRYTDIEMGNFQLTDKIAIDINGKKTWIFHGDVFDHTTTHLAKLWGKLGSNGYATLLAFNKILNRVSQIFTKERLSLSKRIMDEFNKRFVKIDAFEQKIADLAIDKKFDTVICGHIHQPQKKFFHNERGSVYYLNSGDWVENMTSLEYYDNDWHLYTFDDKLLKAPKTTYTKQQPVVTTSEIAFYLSTLSNTLK